MPYTTNIDKHGVPMLVGPQCNCIACPCIKKALDTNPKGWIFIFKSVFSSLYSLWNFMPEISKQIWPSSCTVFMIKEVKLIQKDLHQNWSLCYFISYLYAAFHCNSYKNSCLKCYDRFVVAFAILEIWRDQ